MGLMVTPVASTDPGQNCRTEWNVMYNVRLLGEYWVSRR